MISLNWTGGDGNLDVIQPNQVLENASWSETGKDSFVEVFCYWCIRERFKIFFPSKLAELGLEDGTGLVPDDSFFFYIDTPVLSVDLPDDVGFSFTDVPGIQRNGNFNCTENDLQL